MVTSVPDTYAGHERDYREREFVAMLAIIDLLEQNAKYQRRQAEALEAIASAEGEVL